MAEQMTLEQVRKEISDAHLRTPDQLTDAIVPCRELIRWVHAIDAHLNAAKGEAVAWTVVGPDGKTSIGGWHDMRTFDHIKGWATLREGHQYAFAYTHPASPDVVRDAERYRWLLDIGLDDNGWHLTQELSNGLEEMHMFPERINEAIDAAMAAREGGE